MKIRQDISDPVTFGLYYGWQGFKGVATGRYNWYNWLNTKNNEYKKRYNDTSVDAYEWRAKHSDDPFFGYWWKMANDRDLYAEKEKYQADLKQNTGHNWKDNTYPRVAYNSAFGYSSPRSSPIFDVNDAILDLYNGVRKW